MIRDQHYSDECMAEDHAKCNGECRECSSPCSCTCHVEAITREDVPQEDEFL